MAIDRLGPPPAAKLFVAVMAAQDQYQPVIENEMKVLFGPIERRSRLFNFSQFSEYYDSELGGRVWKYLISFSQLIQADDLVKVKTETEILQRKLTVEKGGRFFRTINLDPGYVTGWNVVLATVKNHGHRVYLQNGIFAEVTLVYRNKTFRGLPWTYSDYLSMPVLEFLETVRQDWLIDTRAAGKR